MTSLWVTGYFLNPYWKKTGQDRGRKWSCISNRGFSSKIARLMDLITLHFIYLWRILSLKVDNIKSKTFKKKSIFLLFNVKLKAGSCEKNPDLNDGLKEQKVLLFFLLGSLPPSLPFTSFNLTNIYHVPGM